ncbi:MAG: biotin--[acetyl-CoA-carboxylase] ligase [Candidatus Coatesbacteria bacterium]|nr:biotin--[acetyl-CoA-carboxylase] ligase [Candidatus Coatesbacteria bacterium]
MAIRWRIERYENLPSTNDIARRVGRAGAPEGLVVVARSQLNGRGRRGDTWYSPLGGLWFSLLLRPDLPAVENDLYAQYAAVALYEPLARHLNVQIKPPNDLYCSGRKFAGILVETEVRGSKSSFAVIGIGVNVNFDRRQLPDDVQDRATTMFTESGRVFALEKLLDELLDSLAEHYELLLRDPLEIRDEYLALVTAHPEPL